MTVQTIPTIEDMTPDQRAELMESLWDSMIRSARRLPSIEWHKQVLGHRKVKFENGEIGYLDWEEAKAMIREKTQ